MLHIILMILKILGILILCILGLVLCVGLLILFCPIRYHLEGSLYGKPEGSVRVTWLLHLVSVLFSYKENRMEFKFCILGIRLEKKKKAEKQEKQEKKRQKKFRIKNLLKNRKERKERDAKKQEESQLTEADRTEAPIEQSNKEQSNKKQSDKKQSDKKQSDKKQSDKEQSNKELSDKKPSTQKPSDSGTPENNSANAEISEEAVPKTKWWQLPSRIIQKIKELLASLKAAIKKFLELLRNLQQKKQTAIAFIKDERNKKAFLYTKKRLFKLLRYILPGKITLKLHYGADDPAVTGMMTGMIYMLYPKSAEKFQLMPEFEHKVFEGELMIKGKVQIFRVLWTMLFIYFHKDCNRILKMILKH